MSSTVEHSVTSDNCEGTTACCWPGRWCTLLATTGHHDPRPSAHRPWTVESLRTAILSDNRSKSRLSTKSTSKDRINRIDRIRRKGELCQWDSIRVDNLEEK
ncbi:hypothetical protein RUM43_005420 [Polyplax serrata]|uniref:Uncharacterized protein n=1 Tax=Polyplax serrata TaxID=468196 RepID=A0AAN8NWP5_POLSC